MLLFGMALVGALLFAAVPLAVVVFLLARVKRTAKARASRVSRRVER